MSDLSCGDWNPDEVSDTKLLLTAEAANGSSLAVLSFFGAEDALRFQAAPSISLPKAEVELVFFDAAVLKNWWLWSSHDGSFFSSWTVGQSTSDLSVGAVEGNLPNSAKFPKSAKPESSVEALLFDWVFLRFSFLLLLTIAPLPVAKLPKPSFEKSVLLAVPFVPRLPKPSLEKLELFAGLAFGLVKLRGVAPGLFRLILFVLVGWFPGSAAAKFHAGSSVFWCILLLLIMLLSLLELALL